MAAARLRKGTAQGFILANSERIFINLCWYDIYFLVLKPALGLLPVLLSYMRLACTTSVVFRNKDFNTRITIRLTSVNRMMYYLNSFTILLVWFLERGF